MNSYICSIPLPEEYPNPENTKFVDVESLFGREGCLTGIGYYNFPVGKETFSSKNIFWIYFKTCFLGCI